MTTRSVLCAVLSHRWRRERLKDGTPVLCCRRCGRVDPLPDRPVGANPAAGPLTQSGGGGTNYG